ncbi:bifunctional adenosylcobinamide kinase/adenosylcobinamide-phosphate guanylyltransferase [Synechococcus sp. BSF8S]|nr:MULTISPECIES: bifunctional adenosylcobinamide kinase/adenosylcobinamide-phosphate guanylyltransferase [unclassified Synechococcus]MBC1260164.1 bifunctional adenosylcobinamide kinase/adenosylcobinamide-phosphate guanylyltransferase [Synechococcus sp. BSF8S]MBC1263019.1 bifunctional adenosylcobinamide kinase/adenosylcobinamide-phosphate guanylyltransferase [Synechococcus sp. BSA11S]
MGVVERRPVAGLTLVSGPSRSGKSRWAEHLAAQSGRSVLYIATGALAPDDQAWQHRLQLHQRRRPRTWTTWEVEGELESALARAPADHQLLIDSLGTWLAHHLDLDGEAWEQRQDALLQALLSCRAPLLIVTEETGWGVVPATAIGGRFRDRLGRLQQRLQPLAQASWLVIQGRALDLRTLSQPVPGL